MAPPTSPPRQTRRRRRPAPVSRRDARRPRRSSGGADEAARGAALRSAAPRIAPFAAAAATSSATRRRRRSLKEMPRRRWPTGRARRRTARSQGWSMSVSRRLHCVGREVRDDCVEGARAEGEEAGVGRQRVEVDEGAEEPTTAGCTTGTDVRAALAPGTRRRARRRAVAALHLSVRRARHVVEHEVVRRQQRRRLEPRPTGARAPAYSAARTGYDAAPYAAASCAAAAPPRAP